MTKLTPKKKVKRQEVRSERKAAKQQRKGLRERTKNELAPTGRSGTTQIAEDADQAALRSTQQPTGQTPITKSGNFGTSHRASRPDPLQSFAEGGFMANLEGLATIVSQLKTERANLANQLRHVDAALTVLGKMNGGTSYTRPRRTLSASARKKISLAQKARWAKTRKRSQPAAAKTTASAPAKRTMSASARRKIAAA